MPFRCVPAIAMARRRAFAGMLAIAALAFGPAQAAASAASAPSAAAASAAAASAAAASAAAASAAAASAADPLERSVKAAFLYKFLLYTEFPPSAFADASAPLVIGLAGADDMLDELGRIVAGRVVQRRPLAVRAVREGEVPPRLHLLFVGGGDAGEVGRVLKSMPAAPMLVVSEANEALRYGSVINFRVVEERVRFDVSLQAADKNHVKISSRLLTVANHVTKGAP